MVVVVTLLAVPSGPTARTRLVGTDASPSVMVPASTLAPEDPAGAPTETPTEAPTDTASDLPSQPPTDYPADDPTTATPLPVGRPNVVLITTDDQRLDDMKWMPYTRRLLGNHGMRFTDALSPHPLCCPARAEIITGQYGQNNGVAHNAGKYGGYDALIDPDNTVARWLHQVGYNTAFTGKYLNDYQPEKAIPSGWTHWNPTIKDIYSYNNTVFFNDGAATRHPDHVDDVVVSYTNAYIREFAAQENPFFVWASALAPHDYVKGKTILKAVPAARHRGMFTGRKNPAHQKPSFDRKVVHGPKRELPRGSKRPDRAFVARIESLQAVDEGVKSIVSTLRETGELNNTIIMFTSDNGFMLGEHGMGGKNFIFAESLEVPFLVRLPHRAGSVTSTVPVTLTDIAPTLADLAHATPGRVMDGTSFAPLLRSGVTQPWRDTQLVQTGSDFTNPTDPGWEVRGVRTARYTYGENTRTGLTELYDRRLDPYELTNLAYKKAYRRVVVELSNRTDILKTCVGVVCYRNFGPVPGPTKTTRHHR